MDIEQLRLYCLSFAEVSEEMPFGPQTLVFKTSGKIFLLVGLDQIEHLSFNVKCDPERAIELRSTFPQSAFPGYHMNKKHWNTLFAHREISDAVLYELIDHSYHLVAKKTKKPS